MRRALPAILLLSLLIVLLWWWPNRLTDPAPGVRVDKFNSLSFGAYRDWESPLTNTFPTAAEADADLAQLAPVTRAVRTYSAIEGKFDTAALAQKHGLKLWQGIWLGSDRSQNDREIARAIELAHTYPDTIERVVVGNEVLLRRDLPPAELIADIDRVKRAVKQPVAYADVWEFWQQFPEVAPHVDIMLIHLLPYWENVPTGIGRAVPHLDDIFRRMRAEFPRRTIAIGETGWPSRGRPRRDAVPSRVNETRFLREFIALSQREHFDYNFIEAFDQRWKYANEGIVGANWGIFTSARTQKIPLHGPVREDPLWLWHAAVSVLGGWALCGMCVATAKSRLTPTLAASFMALGGALGFAAAGTLATLYDVHLELAALVNLLAQALLAALAMLRWSGTLPPAPQRNAFHATATIRGLLRHGRIPHLHGLFEDVQLVFAWTAAVMQALLVFDPRYREFPLGTFAVPVLVAVTEFLRGGRRARSRLDNALAAALAAGAVASAVQEGGLNTASLVWNGCVLAWAGYQAGLGGRRSTDGPSFA